ncbi:MAG: PQQ-dependent sugar dehydrogenase, partial [Gammaproteobacteria bacterium]
FCARVVADNLGFVRHIAVAPNGDTFATLRNLRLGLGGLLQLRDNDADGRLEQVTQVTDKPGMGIAIDAEWLYFGADTGILRWPLQADGSVDTSAEEVLVDGFPALDEHGGKTLALDGAGYLYVNIGAPSNACQAENRVAGSPGQDPCPETENHAGIWRFSVSRPNQQFVEGERYVNGIRNAYALDWHQQSGGLYAVQHGRDQLHELWPEIYTAQQGADLPAEELLRLRQGETYSWPYCYFDPDTGRLVVAPEYGGNDKETQRCSGYPEPVLTFPAHYSPNDMVFYHADQFPHHYQHGAFIAFHGSYNRGDMGQVGYQVVFVPFSKGRPLGNWEVFADDFAGDQALVESPDDAEFRPTGMAVTPDGSLLVSDSVQGRIWRIRYVGETEGF